MMSNVRLVAPMMAVGLILTMALAAPASAFSLIKLTGNHGDFGTKSATADGPNDPGAKCGYSAPDGSGFSYLQWVKVFPFIAGAYDRTSANDIQPITFMVTVQRSKDGGATWRNVGSISQTRNASETQSARFDTLKYMVSGKPGQLFRAITTLKWLHNGATEGLAKMRMEYYGYKWVVNPTFVAKDFCPGETE